MNSFLQRLGKSMLLPISVLPVCGILLGLGYMICPEAIQSGEIEGTVKTIGYVLVKGGSGLIDHMSILFVLGVALGLSDDNHGAACVAGLVSWLTVTTLLSQTTVQTMLPNISEDYLMAFGKIETPFVGILTGCLGAACYNRFRTVKLPKVLGFFSGRRFVAIITVFVSIAFSAVFGLAWPVVFKGMVRLGEGILKLKGVGAGLYVFLNRMLLPFGLHHAFNSVFLFDTVGIGDLTAFWAGKTSADVSWSLGMYMSPCFPCMMLGIPGAALAMYRTAKNRKKVAGILISAVACAFVCGITEPFEFIFMFAAFPLYVVYSVLYGIVGVVTYYAGFRAGFSLSGGALDLFFSSSLPAAAHTWMVIPLGILAFAMFYIVFRFYLSRRGCELFGDDEASATESGATPAVKTGDRDIAKKMLAAVGGASNVSKADCCATRLRLELKDISKANKDAIIKGGALGFLPIDRHNCQIIIGTSVQSVYDAFAAELKGGTEHRRVKHGERIYSFGATKTCFTYKIKSETGIHARPAGEIVRLAGEYPACTLILSANGKAASGASLIEIMQLGAVKGTELSVKADGNGAQELIARLEALMCEKL